MATMVRLTKEILPIVKEVYSRKNSAQANRTREYQAAVKIQSWYRALRARAYLRYIIDCSNVIQKRYRGFQGRKEFRVFLKNEVFVMKLNRYNLLATRIQKVWRGFYVRKYIFNYYSFKRYLSSLLIKNETIRETLAAYKEQQQTERMQAEAKAQRENKEAWLRKHHHLVSTAVVPGIYNSPYLPFETEVEADLRNTKPFDHVKKPDGKPKYNPTATRYDLTTPKPPSLPPIAKKPQGPFRQAEEVRQQRYRPFNPSLRVETSYTAVDEAREAMKQQEWVDRVIDTPFKPFTHRHRNYEPLHHTQTTYGHIPYGTAYFREEHSNKFISTQPMKTLVPPIPIFDKLNATYSQGEV
ncbi:spermatogenesis-associated protein 17-like [Watersipora subatra]|uniref:spermatogenesis-associated protein 17-like n=1 Tax=Watersipora subatra TaxID=2589382 RepID=UPI00355ACE6B